MPLDTDLPLDVDQQLSFHLAGTVALPSPAPASGPIDIVTFLEEDGSYGEVHLRISHKVNRRLVNKRYVRLDDVRAVHAPRVAFAGPSVPRPLLLTDPNSEQWESKTARDLNRMVRERLAKAEEKGRIVLPWLANAIVFVPEGAQVLMQVEVGMTAAESAEYYHPLVGAYSNIPAACGGEKPTY